MMAISGIRGARIGGGSLDERIAAERISTLVDMAARPDYAECGAWFALRVMTGRENAVENSLVGIGVEALVPMRKGPDLRRRHRLIPGQMMPVILGYVLVRVLPEPCHVVALQAVEHAIDVLGGALTPSRLSACEVKRFQDMARAGSYDWAAEARVMFRPGERVRIGDGPFLGFNGEIVSCRHDRRGDAVVSLDIMGRMTPITLPLVILEKL